MKNIYLSEEAIRKLTKDELVNLSLEYQNKSTSTLARIQSDIGNLRNHLKTVEADLAITRNVNSKLGERVVSIERQCWGNSQYSRRECLEINGFPESLKNENLEETVLKVFEELDVVVDPSNVEECHWVASRTSKIVIVKLSRHKDTSKILRVKKNLKNLNLSSLGIKIQSLSTTASVVITKYYGVNARKLSSNKSKMALSD